MYDISRKKKKKNVSSSYLITVTYENFTRASDTLRNNTAIITWKRRIDVIIPLLLCGV